MKKSKKILLSVLTALYVIFTAIGLVGCAEGPSLTVKNDIMYYYVTDSIYVYDLFEYKTGQTYSFKFSYVDSATDKVVENTIRGESFYVGQTGVYTVKATATKNNKSVTKSVEVTVVDEVPIFVLRNYAVKVDLFSGYMQERIIGNLAKPIIISDGVYETYISQISVYKDGEENEPTVYAINGAQPSADGFFDGNKINFIYECKCVAKLVCKTSGGEQTADLTITVEENLSKLDTLEQKIEYDENTGLVSWEAVPGATYYRLKYDGKTVESTDLSVNLFEVLKNEFYYFDFVVVPVDQNGEFMGKLVYEDILITPEGSEGVVLGTGVKNIDSKTKTVELVGTQSGSPGWLSGMDKMENSYIAFLGDHKLGTMVEFTFKGNNLPNVCMFASDLNGNMTQNGGTGFILMNGLYATSDIQQSTSTTNVVGENVLMCLGPNRMGENHVNYISMAQALNKRCFVSEDSLFTQKGLREDLSDRTYKYTVISYEEGGCVAFQVSLTDVATGEYAEKPVSFVTTTKSEDLTGFNIIAYATVKGKNENTVFSYELPKRCPQSMLPGSAVNLAAGTGETATGVLDSVNSISSYVNNYTYVGDYQVGTTFMSSFTGNNMPQFMLFADEVNANMGYGNGYVITNGLTVATDNDGGTQTYANFLYAFGPNRINSSLDEVSKTNFTFETDRGYKDFTEDHVYRYYIGSKIVNGKVVITVEILDETDKTIVTKGEFNTGKTVEEIEGLGDKVVIYAGVKGADKNTQFDFYGVSSEIKENTDGSTAVTLGAGKAFGGYDGRFGSSGYGTGASNYRNNFISLGEYGVGYEFTMNFKGSNMPQIILFSNEEENGTLGKGYVEGTNVYPGGNGYLITNGISALIHTNGNSMIMADYLYAFGPNRIDLNFGTQISSSNFDVISGKVPTSALDLNTQYKYVVGSMLVNNKVVIYAKLYTVGATEDTLIFEGEINTNKSVAEVEEIGKYVLLHAGVKGAKVKTVFSYTAPVLKKTENVQRLNYTVTENQDGSKTYVMQPGDDKSGYDSNGTISGPGYVSDLGNFENTYISLGEFGVGYKFVTTFKGNNMPQFMLFANDESGSLSCGTASEPYPNNGYFIANGIYWRQWTDPTVRKLLPDFMYVWGPNRINYRMDLADCTGGITQTNLTNVTGTQPTETALSDDITYKYVLYTKEVQNSVVIYVAIYNAQDQSLIFSGEYNTGKTTAEIEALGKHVLIHAGIKGTDVTTEFTCYQPEIVQ